MNLKYKISVVDSLRANFSCITPLLCLSNSIFLVDHAWTYLPGKCREQLFSMPGLAQRMANLMDLLQRPTTPNDAWSASSDGSEEEEEEGGGGEEPEVNGLASSNGDGASEGVLFDSST